MTDQTNPADEEIMRLATAADDDAGAAAEPKAEPLELGGDDAPELTAEQKAEAEGKKRNHRPWSQRVDILTARLREAEQRAAEAEARAGGGKGEEAGEQAPDPNDEKYEFGEADPLYLKDLAKHEVRQTLAEERRKAAADEEKTAGHRELAGKLTEGMAAVEKTGTEKYDDFEEKIGAAVEARGGEPLHPIVSVAIAVSPAGADIAYRLATDEAAAEKLEKLAGTNPQQAAIALGELEGQYLESDDDADLNPADPLDLARMIGRERARRKGLKASPAERKQTKAPTPPENKARGGNGQFEVGDDTDDFAAFERKYMGKKG